MNGDDRKIDGGWMFFLLAVGGFLFAAGGCCACEGCCRLPVSSFWTGAQMEMDRVNRRVDGGVDARWRGAKGRWQDDVEDRGVW